MFPKSPAVTRFLFAPDDEGKTGGGEGDQDQTGDTGDTGVREAKEGDESLLALARTGDDAGKDDQSGDTDDKTGDDEADKAKPLTYETRPDWIAENFFDEKTGEIKVEELAKSQRDLRAKLSRGGDKPPAKAEDYTFDIGDSEELKAAEAVLLKDGDREADPLLQWFREAMLDKQVSDADATDIYKGFLKFGAEILPEPLDLNAELKKLGRPGPAMLKGQETFLTSLLEKGVVNEVEGKEIEGWFTSAEAITAFQKIREYYGEKPIPMHTAPPEGAPSGNELRGKMAEVMKKADAGDPGAEAEFQKLQGEYDKLYGDEPAGTSPLRQ